MSDASEGQEPAPPECGPGWGTHKPDEHGYCTGCTGLFGPKHGVSVDEHSATRPDPVTPEAESRLRARGVWPAGREATRAEKVAAFRAYLDSLDEQTRRPGEPPLREAVAQQARERLAEMDERKRDA